MSPTVQFNIRTAPSVAESVRARAHERGCSLGVALAELVEAGRAWSGDGMVLRPDPALRRALAALAAAESTTPQRLLEDALRGELRLRLLRLADRVAPAGGDGLRAEGGGSLRDGPGSAGQDGPDADDAGVEVGLFTVFD